jgi:hypothetical protein
VDVIKSLVGTVHPFGFGIVNVELDIGRYPCGLDGTEVGAYDLSAGVLVGKVYGPDAGAGTNVENALGSGWNGRIVEFAA